MSEHTLTEAEKRLCDWLMTHPEGGEMWLIVKGGFRRSYALGAHGAADAIEAMAAQFLEMCEAMKLPLTEARRAKHAGYHESADCARRASFVQEGGDLG